VSPSQVLLPLGWQIKGVGPAQVLLSRGQIDIEGEELLQLQQPGLTLIPHSTCMHL